jgi:hydroxybutyrate-dimer hydrolase
MMWDHLKLGRALPASQLVRTKPREQKDGKALPIAAANVPPIQDSLGANALISVGLDGTLRIPD